MEGGAPVVRAFSEADTDFRAAGELAKFVEDPKSKGETKLWLL